MTKVRMKVEGIIQVEENRLRAAKNVAIAVTLNNTQNSFPKHQETKRKLEERQRQLERRSDQKKRPTESKENDYNCNPQKKFKLDEEEFDYTFICRKRKYLQS